MKNWIRSADGVMKASTKGIAKAGKYLANQQKARKDTLYGKRMPLTMENVKKQTKELGSLVKKRFSE